jgi:hypothetical protein
VHLRIQKPTGAQENLSITRDVIVVEESYARGALLSHKGQPTYGYIYLPSFYGGRAAGLRTAAGDVRRLLQEIRLRPFTTHGSTRGAGRPLHQRDRAGQRRASAADTAAAADLGRPHPVAHQAEVQRLAVR